jgi:hypothetical protein
MSNPYVDYYHKQIGSGIPGFRGLRYQRGYGFLTSLISKAIVPLFRSIRNVDPGNVVKMAADVLKAPGLIAGKPLADDIARIGATAAGALINTLQGGKGRRYKGKGRRYKGRKRRKMKSVAKKSCNKKRRVCALKTRRRKQKRVFRKKVKKSTKRKPCKKRTGRKRKSRRIRRKSQKLIDALGS